MKIWLNKLSLLCLMSLVLVSCEKDEEQVNVTVGGAPTITASASEVVLVEAQAEETALTISWNPMDLTWSDPSVSHSGAVNYILQFDTEGDNFASPEEFEIGSSQEKAFTHGELNALLNRMELEPGKASTVLVRLFPHLGDNQTPVYSNTITMSLTPWLDKPKFATVYMVGDATKNGWNNPGGTPMFRSEANPFLFTYTGYLKAGALKFVQKDGLWAPQWGSDGTATGVAFRETEQDPDPGTFSVAADGYYTAALNLRNNTFTLTPYNAAGATAYSSIGLIGPFTDWSSIIPMENSTFNPHYWSLEHTFTEATEMKFRIAEDWSVNWGAGADQAAIYGKGSQNSDNIKVAAGTYRIIFNDLTGNYVLIKK
ncbi:SusE domain-containing protein [Pontibacter sp. E15-1]|uniref:SusE domain-containing protein n=1 Tax=Pontibacter sp. E15-1 TaxID=2919918 RepID=UPI001F4F5D61|nr:SusE domain-containing protein [Pontibacter sp. E15-1]MCJ8164249.1 SusE domain-containing protein [Pontibacter sp. E15-1]